MNRIDNEGKRKKDEKLSRKREKQEKKDIKNNIVSSKKKSSQTKENINKRQEKREKRDKETEKGQKKRFSILKFLLKLFLIIILLLGICAGIFYYKIQENGGGIKGALITVLGLKAEDIQNLDTINVLLLGVSQDLDSTLTDTIIVCSYNPKKQSAFMLSIPRDTFIGTNKNSPKGTDKINSLYSKNPEKLLKKVSN